MKSLKSRLRRQDAPGPTSSGAAAAASAVSPAARARPGSLRSLPAESPSARKRALLPWLLSAPGSAAAATPPPSGRGSAFAWRPWGPSPPPPPGLAGPLPRPFPPASERLVRRSNRSFLNPMCLGCAPAPSQQTPGLVPLPTNVLSRPGSAGAVACVPPSPGLRVGLEVRAPRPGRGLWTFCESETRSIEQYRPG